MNLMIPFTPKLLPRKGIAQAPGERGTIDPRMQDTLLEAIARSRRWMGAVLAGKTASFDEIASAEGLAERHIRRLVPLAFLSPKIIQAIADGIGSHRSDSLEPYASSAPCLASTRENARPQLRQAASKRSELTGCLICAFGGSRPHATANARI